ncbi:tetraprenyl-beta-curcumene synthase family protein [Neobacillus sedimentimangrovi]|jgi:tetraprenyl-beta-curcumene synthase|uniref:Tetraprenyl-beta-curcumene synthase family protein n=1 Tax=Neobacillus sedimentimangrovi TaxID=2699460 RepID=A0ABS8QJS4_9BACI|nr:tetraprenyl-beta-curcumene synthase family protein [Neobacillus sedimentimangrovi]MCD4839528.1 tetraprenyl-beta-curcumene synthase family protein [Neobacillus sedimentimangrovi]
MMPITLMAKVYRKILPAVHQELAYWKSRAENIPNPELRKQALASIAQKAFHCEGGAILALTANEHYQKAVKFIVAYQTISDYLDNLCDRSTSLDPNDFAALHESMSDALKLQEVNKNYYRLREDQDDDGYLHDLSKTCRTILREIEHYDLIKDYLLELCEYYCDLQIHKHVKEEERVGRLEKWFQQYQKQLPDMEWYEFSACSGSTLGIFCLVSYAMRKDFTASDAANIRKGYFPYIQGLHILLDYFIDQEEDVVGGDLNFCFYYDSQEILCNRLKYFVSEADRHTELLPHKKFHQLINRGLLGIYLSDSKVRKQKDVRKLAKEIIKSGGWISYFFYLNGVVYRSLQKAVPSLMERMLITK